MNTDRSGIAPRKPFTREELVKIFDEYCASLYKRKSNPFWGDMARRGCDRKLKEFDAGEAVEVVSSEYIENSYSYADVLMSDGTVRTVCYGYWD